jgi:alkanesulfonate monooxygenase SsuD/methylene tetrahydromethanopterin reductase-like flavin-dependent oxidoreductase (luciferase family)
MKLGMTIRNWGPRATPEFLTECARIAYRSTLDAIWFNDHLGFPPELPAGMPVPREMGDILDPLGFANYLAACTSRIMFGTGVLVLPYRPEIVTQKLLTTIQVLSGNRFLLGVGTGYLEGEFKALGVSKSQRGKLTDQTIDFLRGSAEHEQVISNKHPLILKPKLKCPPIYIGGAADVAIPRTVSRGDGWMPMGTLPDALAPLIARLHEAGAAAGRDGLEVVMMKTLPMADRAAAVEMARAYQQAGVTHLIHVQPYDSPQQFAEVLAQFDGEIRGALQS